MALLKRTETCFFLKKNEMSRVPGISTLPQYLLYCPKGVRSDYLNASMTHFANMYVYPTTPSVGCDTISFFLTVRIQCFPSPKLVA